MTYKDAQIETLLKENQELKSKMEVMITPSDLKEWICDVNGQEFIEQIYGRTTDTDAGGYAIGKFQDMQNRFHSWLSNLDDKHRDILAKAVNNHRIKTEKAIEIMKAKKESK